MTSSGVRRLFLAGLSIFAVMGILGACASDPSMIVLARLGQGIGAGTISSQVLGIITDRVSGKARAKALGAYSTAGWSGRRFRTDPRWRSAEVFRRRLRMAVASRSQRAVCSDHTDSGVSLSAP